MKVYVTDFGATPNKYEVQTTFFQNAIDYCFNNGGGEVVVPEGEYVIGDIRLRSNITLHLLKNAKILGSKNPKDYLNIHNDKLEPLDSEQATNAKWYAPSKWIEMGGGFKTHLYTAGSYWNYGIIRAVYAQNVAIIGEEGSVIDGRNVYDKDGEENYRGPHAINMHFCKNVKFDGYTVVDAANWAHLIFQSENVTFNNVSVFAGHDALHTRACDNVTITNCHLETGDDCIAGFNNNDVIIKDCYISSACSAFRFGGNNILIENCDVFAPCKYQFRGSFSYEEKMKGIKVSEKGRNNMLCFYTNFVSDDLPCKKESGKIIIKNCNIDGADRLFHLNMSGNEPWQRGIPPTDVTFENIKAKNIMTGLYAYGKEGCPFNMTLKNVEYEYKNGSETEPFIKTAYFEKIKLENVTVTNYQGHTFIKTWSDGGKTEVKNLNSNILENEFVVKATEPFVCRAI